MKLDSSNLETQIQHKYGSWNLKAWSCAVLVRNLICKAKWRCLHCLGWKLRQKSPNTDSQDFRKIKTHVNNWIWPFVPLPFNYFPWFGICLLDFFFAIILFNLWTWLWAHWNEWMVNDKWNYARPIGIYYLALILEWLNIE